jgi:MinD superfamily P-loop ATPase
MIITIASGKGGTGKTLVATSLAVSLSNTEPVQLLDCDVEEPNDHLFLKPTIEKTTDVVVTTPQIDESKCNLCKRCADVCAYHAIAVIIDKVLIFPELCHGCGACTHFCPTQALSEIPRTIGTVETGVSGPISFSRGLLQVGEATATPVIRAVKSLANNTKTVIIDASPGTSCPVVEAVEKSDFCLLVTESTPFGLSDLTIAVEMVRTIGVPYGVLINRFDHGDGEVERFCAKEQIPIMMKIPFKRSIAQAYARGQTLAETSPQWQAKFQQLAQDIQKIIVRSGAREVGVE